jgi:hypothetical protein
MQEKGGKRRIDGSGGRDDRSVRRAVERSMNEEDKKISKREENFFSSSCYSDEIHLVRSIFDLGL